MARAQGSCCPGFEVAGPVFEGPGDGLWPRSRITVTTSPEIIYQRRVRVLHLAEQLVSAFT